MGDWTWDAASDSMFLSERAAEIFGLPPEAPRTWTKLTEQLHPADAARAIAAMQKAAETQTEYNLEYRVTRADNGARVWVAAQGRALYDKEGSFTGMTGVVQDITDRKHAEQRQHLLIRELHHRVGRVEMLGHMGERGQEDGGRERPHPGHEDQRDDMRRCRAVEEPHRGKGGHVSSRA